MVDDWNKMKENSYCPVCDKELRKGKKFYGAHSQGHYTAYTCSKKCNKIFDVLFDYVFDTFNTIPSEEDMVIDIRHLFEEHQIDFHQFIYNRMNKDKTPVEITVEIFALVKDLKESKNEA